MFPLFWKIIIWLSFCQKKSITLNFPEKMNLGFGLQLSINLIVERQNVVYLPTKNKYCFYFVKCKFNLNMKKWLVLPVLSITSVFLRQTRFAIRFVIFSFWFVYYSQIKLLLLSLLIICYPIQILIMKLIKSVITKVEMMFSSKKSGDIKIIFKQLSCCRLIR